MKQNVLVMDSDVMESKAERRAEMDKAIEAALEAYVAGHGVAVEAWQPQPGMDPEDVRGMELAQARWRTADHDKRKKMVLPMLVMRMAEWLLAGEPRAFMVVAQNITKQMVFRLHEQRVAEAQVEEVESEEGLPTPSGRPC